MVYFWKLVVICYIFDVASLKKKGIVALWLYELINICINLKEYKMQLKTKTYSLSLLSKF